MLSNHEDETESFSGNRGAPTTRLLSHNSVAYGTIECEQAAKLELPYHNSPRPEQKHHILSILQDPNHLAKQTSIWAGSIDGSDDDDSLPTATLWKDEIKTIVLYTAPMMLSMLLQTSISVSSIFVIGRLGAQELGAVSLANMTAIISGYVVYQGCSMSLDTTCPQAYGSGRHQLVGLHMQRMTAFLLLLTVPISAVWFNAARIIAFLIPDEHSEIANLAGTYLRIISLGAPGFACFETGKKFVQAQGLFRATLSVLLICAPLNAVMSWTFVWKLGWGFNGAPISVAITNNLLPILLALYVRFIAGYECWHPLSRKIFQNWRPMIRLAIPSFLMLGAGFLAWEIETIVSSYIGSVELAAQSALASIVSLGYQICTSAAIASSTRISNSVGAGLRRRALVAACISMGVGVLLGTSILVLVYCLGENLPRLFTTDAEVLSEIMGMLHIYAVIALIDGIVSSCNGILCAVGRPKAASYSQLFSSWIVCLPLSLLLAFTAQWKLLGIWIGCLAALIVCALTELWFVLRLDWDRALNEAKARNK